MTLKDFPRFRLPYLFAAAIIVTLSFPGAAEESQTMLEPEKYSANNPPGKPWRVYTDSATVYTKPGIDSEALGELQEGDEMAGHYLVAPETDEQWLQIDFQGKTGYVSATEIHRVYPGNIVEGDIPYGQALVNRWWGLPHDYEPSDLVDLPPVYTISDEEGRYQLRREAAESLIEMLDEARDKGFDIRVGSAYRSGSTQMRIYRRNVKRNRAQRSSAPPGHSEHQLGSTVDLMDVDREFSWSQAFGETPESKWLEDNAHRFGWRRTYYPHNTGETGYISEPWHWRYMGKELPAPTDE